MKCTAAVLLLLVVALAALLSPAAAVLPEDEMMVDIYRHAGPLFSASLQGGSCPKFQCAISVAKCGAAAIEAYTKKDPSILLKCIDKEHVCLCVNCLPDAIATWIKTAVGCPANAANSLFDGASPASASAKPLGRAAAAADDSESDFNAQDCANVVASALGNKDQLASPLVRKCNVRLLALHHTLLTPSQAAHAPAGKPDHASGSSSGGGKSSPIHAQASVGGPFLDKCNCPNICIGGCIPFINTCAGVCA